MRYNFRSNSFYTQLFKNIDFKESNITEQDKEIVRVYSEILISDPYNLGVNNFLNEHCVLGKDDNNNSIFCGFEDVNVKIIDRLKEIKEK